MMMDRLSGPNGGFSDPVSIITIGALREMP